MLHTGKDSLTVLFNYPIHIHTFIVVFSINCQFTQTKNIKSNV